MSDFKNTLSEQELDQLNYIYDNINYDLVVDDTVKYHGTLSYISDHFGDTVSKNDLSISKNQPKDLQTFVDEYLRANNQCNGNLSIADFYSKRKAI